MTVIFIHLYETMESPARNKLRYAMEMGKWRNEVRQAKPNMNDPTTWDWDKLQQLDEQFNHIGGWNVW